jgi:hypothetical protein
MAEPIKTEYMPCNSCGRLMEVSPRVALRPCTTPGVVLCGTAYRQEDIQVINLKGLKRLDIADG